MQKKNSSFFDTIQPRLSINQPNDSYEQEADAMAEKVMRMPIEKNTFFQPAANSIQRKCSHCEEEENNIHRKESNAGSAVEATPSVHHVLQSRGQSMDHSTRSFMESRFGHDFSHVQIHDDSLAHQSSSHIHARAFTHGNHIVFGSGQYQQHSNAGKKLLAHELTHVIQQSKNTVPLIQRQPDDDTAADDKAKQSVEKNEVVKRLEEDTTFNKLKKKVKDEIKDQIKHAPEKITEVVLDQIIDATVTDSQYNTGLKKAVGAIIKTITGAKPASTGKCDATPGFHEGSSRDFKGQCCSSSVESAETCCPKDKFAPKETASNCCKADEVVNAEGKCEKVQAVDLTKICAAPGIMDSTGKCCMPPFQVIDGICATPAPKEKPKGLPFSSKFTIGIIDDYNIDDSILNHRQKTHFEEVKKQIHQFMEVCPSSMVTITGFADKPGTEEHNMNLGQRRADYMKTLIQLDLIKINFRGLSPLIFARSEGENNPADVQAGENFSAANRRVEIEFSSLCPTLGDAVATKPLSDASLRMGSPLKLGN